MTDATYHVVARHPFGNARVTIIQPRTLAEAEREAAIWRGMGLEATVVQDVPYP